MISYGVSNPVYRIWKVDTHKVYDVAAPSFDEDAKPGWWRIFAAAEEDEEQLILPDFPDLLAVPAATITGVVDTSDQGNPPDMDSGPVDISDSDSHPPVSLVPAATPPAPSVPASAAGPVLTRSKRANRGVPPAYMADMLVIATMESPASEPQTYKQAMKLPDFAEWLAACATEVASGGEQSLPDCRQAGR